MLSYFYDLACSFTVRVWISEKKLCKKGSIVAEMPSRASYLVSGAYGLLRCVSNCMEGEFEQIITKICLSIKDNNN